jgi:hypothetical protein
LSYGSMIHLQTVLLTESHNTDQDKSELQIMTFTRVFLSAFVCCRKKTP